MPINIPNTLSIIRILLTPLFVILLIRGMFLSSLLVFAIAGVSDALDGLSARYLNQRTVLGAYLDPIADKILLMSAFITLAVLDVIPPWLTVIVISRDVIIVIGHAVSAILTIPIEIKPSVASKCTTVAQLLTIFLALLSPAGAGNMLLIKKAFCWFTACLTIASGLHYIYVGLSILQDAAKEQERLAANGGKIFDKEHRH
jgi:cardiolipin synthase